MSYLDYETMVIIYSVSGILGAIIGGCITGGIASAIGNSKNYQGHPFALGFFLGVIGIIIVAVASPGPSQEKQTADLGWTCPSCHTNNSNDSAFCKHCGAQRPKPVVQNRPTQTKLEPNTAITGTFKGEKFVIQISNTSFKIISGSTIVKSGNVFINGDKLYLISLGDNKKMELTVIQNNILVTTTGTVFKKITPQINSK